MKFTILRCVFVATSVLVAGCTTEAAKKAMNKPVVNDQYAGFDSNDVDASKRKAELPKVVPDSQDSETAVSTLVQQLQSEKASYSIAAEDQLAYWGSKPGVRSIVTRKVRPLLKSRRVEHRGPALRLTMQFGGRESVGDLIECLNDSEASIRVLAYQGLQGQVSQDFGYDPNAGEGVRARSVDQYRRWWQASQSRIAVQPPTIYEGKEIAPPRVVSPPEAASTR